MTSITRNLPWFIRDSGVSIIGKECYVSLVENLDVYDSKCLRYAFSKALGIGLVIGGSIMKLPQLLLILNAHSARGLSLTAFALETVAYTITTAYPLRNAFPFSTYGENFFLSIQNILITLLIIHYSPRYLSNRRLRRTHMAQAATAAGALVAALLTLPMPLVALLQLATLPLSVLSKLPQIRQNYRARSTGQLSAFAVFSQVAGCLARLFTTATETGDVLVAAAFGMALLLNSVLGAQLWLYWGNWGVDVKLDEAEMGVLGGANGLGRHANGIGFANGNGNGNAGLYENVGLDPRISLRVNANGQGQGQGQGRFTRSPSASPQPRFAPLLPPQNKARVRKAD